MSWNDDMGATADVVVELGSESGFVTEVEVGVDVEAEASSNLAFDLG